MVYPFGLPAPALFTSAPDLPTWDRRAIGFQRSGWSLPNAVDLSADELTEAVAQGYEDTLARVSHPVRFWNFIPRINEPLDERQTRYMAFNAGRVAAFDHFPKALAATASGVGHSDRDLMIFCLSADEPGTPIDNPRQIPPHRYSARYGPRPPSFARATRVGQLLMVGGTASIRGEATVHEGDLPGQVAETLINLSAVLAAAGDGFALTDVRAYHLPEVDPANIAPLLPAEWRVEWVPAELCRPELLVEIEGLAEMNT